jgi:hypothetical protein
MLALDRLDTLSAVYHQLDSLLSSPTPPSSIFVQSASNVDLTLRLLDQLLTNRRRPLPSHIQINLEETLSARNLFQSILNHFANWHPPYSLSNIQSWNGQTNINKSNQAAFTWDYSQIGTDLRPTKSKGLLSQRKSSSFDGFCDGLRVICHQLSLNQHDQPSSSECLTNFPRFIILNKPELLRSWKEFNILTSLTRLAELSECPVHVIFVSALPWPKIRPRYGALDPLSISIPRLSEEGQLLISTPVFSNQKKFEDIRKKQVLTFFFFFFDEHRNPDLIQILTNDGPADMAEIESPDLRAHSAEIFHAFVTFIVGTFNSQTSADLYELSILVHRLWPDWIARMDSSGC